MKSETSAPLVGMRFRPPALTILQGLGMDQPLVLIREPSNAYDENAISVHLPDGWEEENPELFAEARAEVPELSTFHTMLGYVARHVAELWAPVFDTAQLSGEPYPPARLTFTSTGGPQVTLLIETDITQDEDVVGLEEFEDKEGD